MYAWSMWPMSYWELITGPEYLNYTQIAFAPILFLAGLYTAILALLFLPVALRLKGACLRLVDLEFGGSPAGNRRQWIQERGLSLSISEALQCAFAIFSPILMLLITAFWGLP